MAVGGGHNNKTKLWQLGHSDLEPPGMLLIAAACSDELSQPARASSVVRVPNPAHCFAARDTCPSLSGSVGGGSQSTSTAVSCEPAFPCEWVQRVSCVVMLESWWDGGVN